MRMKVMLALVTFGALCVSAQAGGSIKVFILAGQSNMEGQGVVSMDHPKYYNGGKGNLVWSMKNSKSKSKMKHLRKNGKWVERDDVTISYKVKGTVRKGNLTVGYTGYGRDTHIGPELQFGHVMGDHYKEPVLLIKTAWGGKSLCKDFRPPSSGGTTGPYYKQMIAEVREALAALEGKEYEIVGFIWQQGWNDMVDRNATAEYADNLVNLAKDVRKEFKSPKLPIVVGELGNGSEAFAKEQEKGTKRIRNALFVKTRFAKRDPKMSPNTSHGHHWFGNAESYFLVGEALALGMKRLL